MWRTWTRKLGNGIQMSRYWHAMLCGVVQGLELTRMSMCLLGQTSTVLMKHFDSALFGVSRSCCKGVLVWILRNQCSCRGILLSISVSSIFYATPEVWISSNPRPRRYPHPRTNALNFLEIAPSNHFLNV